MAPKNDDGSHRRNTGISEIQVMLNSMMDSLGYIKGKVFTKPKEGAKKMAVGYFYSKDDQFHIDNGFETKERIRTINKTVEQSDLARQLKPFNYTGKIDTGATEQAEIILPQVHPSPYMQKFEKRRQDNGGSISMNQHTVRIAKSVVSRVIRACDLVKRGILTSAFCTSRPPGHHATKNQSMGFCFLNNIAAGARYLQHCGLQKILIVDFDYHHGNGTEDIFRDDPSVLTFSTHDEFRWAEKI